MRKVSSVIYGIFGVSAIAFGVVNLLFPSFMVTEAGRSFLVSHLLREEAAAAIFIGSMFLWCILNYERRRPVHYFLIVFAFLIAAIHWFDYLTGHLNWMSPLYNSVPFIVLLSMALVAKTSAATTT